MSRLAVLAEIGAPVLEEGRPWGLRRADLEALEGVRAKLGRRGAVLVAAPAKAAPLGTGDPALDADRPPDADPVDAAGALAVGLAGAAAAAGTRTVLVECDVVRPRLAASLGLEPVPGLHEYLRWEATPEEVVQTLVPAGEAAGEGAATLAFVCAGRQADFSRTLFGLGSFRHMTSKLRDAYELTILLGPPAGAGQALDLVAARTEGSIVALPGPDRGVAKAVEDAMSALGVPALGVVVVTPG